MTQSRSAIAMAAAMLLIAGCLFFARDSEEAEAARRRYSTGGVGGIQRVSIRPDRVKAGMEVQARVDTRISEERLRFSWRVGDGDYVEGTSRFEVPHDAGRTRLSVRVELDEARTFRSVASSVVVGNRPPLLGSVALEPASELSVGETLYVRASGEDPDGDLVRFEYRWSVNGRSLRHAAGELPADRLAVGDRVEVEVWASDGVDRSEVARLGPVERKNSLPLITSRPPEPAGALAFEYRIEAHDPDDSRRLRYQLLEGPAGTSLDPLSGRLTWDPSRADPGRHSVLVAVQDWSGGRATQRFDVEVDTQR